MFTKDAPRALGRASREVIIFGMGRASVVALLLVTADVLSMREVHADEATSSLSPASGPAPTGESNQSEAPERWYGWQTLTVDAGSIGLAALAFSNWGGSEAFDLFLASGAVYLGGAPLVHAAHRRGIAALADFGLRLAAPTVLGAVGAASGGGRNGAFVGVVILGSIGLATASLLDAFFLAREPMKVDAKPVAPQVGWLPQVAIMPGGGASAGVGGTF